MAIVGCSQRMLLEKSKTVEWYKANHFEREAKLKQCKSGSIEHAATHNCVNANRAKNSNAWGQTGVGSSPVGPIVVHDIVR